MSYSENYKGTVSYSGSVSYSYPASERGGSGTAHYQGTVPVSVTINVDTNPFDNSVDNFKTSIDALGGSLVAMQTAQCAAIKQTSIEISDSLIKGFFGTINTELSQQIQELDSAIKATFGLIQQQDKAVLEMNNIMEADYNRISSRYLKLFENLDTECYKRIFALDRQSFSLSEKVQKELLTDSPSNAAALNILGIEEISSTKNFVFISSLNKKSVEVLNALHNYITQEMTIRSLLDSFLINEETSENIPLCIPAVWIESDITQEQDSKYTCFFAENIEQNCIPKLTDGVNVFFKQGQGFKWENQDDLYKEALNREFNILTETNFVGSEEEKEQRIYKTMMTLWQNAELKILEKI